MLECHRRLAAGEVDKDKWSSYVPHLGLFSWLLKAPTKNTRKIDPKMDPVPANVAVIFHHLKNLIFLKIEYKICIVADTKTK